MDYRRAFLELHRQNFNKEQLLEEARMNFPGFLILEKNDPKEKLPYVGKKFHYSEMIIFEVILEEEYAEYEYGYEIGFKKMPKKNTVMFGRFRSRKGKEDKFENTSFRLGKNNGVSNFIDPSKVKWWSYIFDSSNSYGQES